MRVVGWGIHVRSWPARSLTPPPPSPLNCLPPPLALALPPPPAAAGTKRRTRRGGGGGCWTAAARRTTRWPPARRRRPARAAAARSATRSCSARWSWCVRALWRSLGFRRSGVSRAETERLSSCSGERTEHTGRVFLLGDRDREFSVGASFGPYEAARRLQGGFGETRAPSSARRRLRVVCV